MRRFLSILAALLCMLHPAAAQGFDPADHGNVTLHLKAGDLALGNNAPVASWGPFSAAGAAQPAYIASDARFNNMPVVKFDGNSDVMTWGSANLGARTIFAVTTIESGGVSLAGLISNGGDGLNIRRNGTGSFYRSPGQGMDGNDFVGNGSPAGTLHVNNVASGSFTVGSPHLVMAVAGGLKNYSTMWLGNANGSLGRWWNGAVAEILVYDGVLSAQGIQEVGYYLQAKYNLPTTFPAPTPKIEAYTATDAAGISSSVGVQSQAGGAVALAWSVSNAASVSISNGAQPSTPAATGSVNVNPSATTTYVLSATNSSGTVTRSVTVHVGATPQPPRINEFLASNTDGIVDEDGTHSDWIEIFNPNPYAIDLQGYRLQDSGATWDFPAGSAIEAGGYRVVFASGKNRGNPANALHTNFGLQDQGEYLALVRIADGVKVSEFLPGYPAQYPDISYGFWDTPIRLGYFGAPTGAPTPGEANSATGVTGFLDFTDAPAFSTGRGFYTAAVSTVLSASTPGAKIIYTTNGTEPSESNGTQVQPANGVTPPSVTITIHPGAVPGGSTGVNIPSIGGVTMLRAAVFLAGYAPTRIETQTYLFPARVLGQTVSDANARGWPNSVSTGQLFNYGMDPAVVSSFPAQEMLESLQNMPTLSIVTNMANLVDPTTGIYVNADQHGSAWERPVSLEMIHPPGYQDPDGNAAGFQVDAGLRIRGGFSRNDQFVKHGFRVFFSKKYEGKLRFRMFGNEGTDEFGKLDLGTASNYGWHRESSYSNGRFNTFCRDPFARDTQGALGQPNTKSRYYHLYINGHYWGVYYTEERAEAEYAASYMGGDEDEYDAVKCGNHVAGFVTEATDGTLDAWHDLWNKTRAIGTVNPSNAKYFEILGRNADGTRNPALPVLLDIDNLIDEMLVIFFMGDGDAVLSNFLEGHSRPNNWFSLYRRDGSAGFRFFIRDAEHTLGAPSWVADKTGPWNAANTYNIAYANPQSMHQDLMASPAYRLRFADRVRKHFFRDGALTPARTLARFQARAAQVEKAMKAESARWGDAQNISGLPGGHPPRYVFSDWQQAVNEVTANILPGRTNTVLAQLRTDGLYPNVNAANYLDHATGLEQYGGPVSAGFQLRLTATSGTIYYTLDGSDPRSATGTVAGTVYTAPIAIAGNTQVNARVLVGSIWSALDSAFFTVDTVPASAANLVVSRIDYNPVDGNSHEFLELMNISAQSLDLTGVHLREAVDFDFAANTILPPGGRIQVAGDVDAFTARFGSGPPLMPVGPFLGNLSNSGESLRIVSDTQGDLRQFAFDDDLPWPVEADGGGYHLVLKRPSANPDHALGQNWRGSGTETGAPGASDTTPFTGIAGEDGDADGLNALMEYALGSSDGSGQSGTSQVQTTVQSFVVNGVQDSYLTLTVRRSATADDTDTSAEFSTDLLLWRTEPEHVMLVSRLRIPASGEVVEVWRAAQPVEAGGSQFLRFRAVLP